MNISQSLGVNCTFCHNTRSFFDWSQSSPRRVLAWHGIRMVRDLNMTYLDQVKGLLPADRLGPNGAGPRVNCATCHQGAHKPLLGVNLVKTFPELQGGGTAPPAAQPAPQPQAQ
jgi:photosynthetic reaction center cytochrome c subunit